VRALRYLVALGAWVVAGYVALWFAANTKIGPVVAIVSTTHGVHEGDIVILVAGAAVASMITVAALRSPRS
jgi:hypothetical protein